MEPLTVKDYKDLTIEQAEQVAETLKDTEDPHEWGYVTNGAEGPVLGRGQVQNDAR